MITGYFGTDRHRESAENMSILTLGPGEGAKMLHRTLRNAKRRAEAITRSREQEREFERHRAENEAWYRMTRERYARGELTGSTMSPEALEAIRVEVLRE